MMYCRCVQTECRAVEMASAGSEYNLVQADWDVVSDEEFLKALHQNGIRITGLE